jgi:hypothetical protein
MKRWPFGSTSKMVCSTLGTNGERNNGWTLSTVMLERSGDMYWKVPTMVPSCVMGDCCGSVPVIVARVASGEAERARDERAELDGDVAT